MCCGACLTVFEIFSVKQFAILCGCGCILLLNVMEVLSVGGCALMDISCIWSSKENVCCACDPSVYLSVPSIGFVYVFVCQK